MVFAIVLFSLFLILQLPGLRRPWPTHRERAAIAAGLFFVGAGVMHFVSPAMYVAMIPPALPAPHLLVWLSGVAEIACGVGLLCVRTRRLAAWATLVLLVAILPANVYEAQRGSTMAAKLGLASWYDVVRVPFQLVYVAWVAWAGGLLGARVTGGALATGTSPGSRDPRC